MPLRLTLAFSFVGSSSWKMLLSDISLSILCCLLFVCFDVLILCHAICIDFVHNLFFSIYFSFHKLKHSRNFIVSF